MVVALVLSACSDSKSKAEPDPEPTTTNPSTSSTSATTAAVPTTAPGPPTFMIPASIRHDCTLDVSDAIQAWIDSVPDSAVLALRPGGCYRIDETLVVANRHHLVIDGKGAVLRAVTTGNRTRQQLVLSGGSDLTVRSIFVQGANPQAGTGKGAYNRALEAQHAFQVSGASNVLLDHVHASDVYGDFVYVGPENGQPSRNVTIANSTFERSGRQGISVTDAENVTIAANHLSGVPQSIFDIEPNTASQEARSIRIIGNVTGAGGQFWFANKGAPADVGDIEITGNRMTTAAGGLIFVYAAGGAYRGPFVITNNQFIAGNKTHDEQSTGALFFTRAEDVTIRGNRITFPKGVGMPATEFRNSHKIQVSDNVFTNAGPKVLATQGSTDLDVH